MPFVGTSKRGIRTLESKGPSALRVSTPANLDLALEGLVRKVLREQPKQEDIYAFAAEYFETLVDIRDKAESSNASAKEICPERTEAEGNDLIKLALLFPKPLFLQATAPTANDDVIDIADEKENDVTEPLQDEVQESSEVAEDTEIAERDDGNLDKNDATSPEVVSDNKNEETSEKPSGDDENVSIKVPKENDDSSTKSEDNEDVVSQEQVPENNESNDAPNAFDHEVVGDDNKSEEQTEAGASDVDPIVEKVDNDDGSNIEASEETVVEEDSNVKNSGVDVDENKTDKTSDSGEAQEGCDNDVNSENDEGIIVESDEPANQQDEPVVASEPTEGSDESEVKPILAESSGEPAGNQENQPIDATETAGGSDESEVKDLLAESSGDPAENKENDANIDLLSAEAGETVDSLKKGSDVNAAFLASETGATEETQEEQQERDIIREFIENEKQYCTQGNSTISIEVAEVYEPPAKPDENLQVETVEVEKQSSDIQAERLTELDNSASVDNIESKRSGIIDGVEINNIDDGNETKDVVPSLSSVTEKANGLVGGIELLSSAVNNDEPVIPEDGAVDTNTNDEVLDSENKEQEDDLKNNEDNNGESTDNVDSSSDTGAGKRKKRDLSEQMSTENDDAVNNEEESGNENREEANPSIEGQAKVVNETAPADTEADGEEKECELKETPDAVQEESKSVNDSKEGTELVNEAENVVIENVEKDIEATPEDSPPSDTADLKSLTNTETKETEAESTNPNEAEETEKESGEETKTEMDNTSNEGEVDENADVITKNSAEKEIMSRASTEAETMTNDTAEADDSGNVEREKSEVTTAENADLPEQSGVELDEIKQAAESAIEDIVQQVEVASIETATKPEPVEESSVITTNENNEVTEENAEGSDFKNGSTDAGQSSKDTESLDDENPFISAEVISLIEAGNVNGEDDVKVEDEDSKDENDVIVPLNATIGTIEETDEGGLATQVGAVHAANVIQKNYRQYLNRKNAAKEAVDDGKPIAEQSEMNETLMDSSSTDSTLSSSATKIRNKREDFAESTIETTSQSFCETAPPTTPKTSGMSPRQNAIDTEVWGALEKELDTAATKIQNSFRDYRSRKTLQREDAVQITTASEDSEDGVVWERLQGTGELHDTIVPEENKEPK